ncbi:hypothetical protein BDV96DRAFT_658169 [Lophiotrema nucula]|uniref:Uncharacterized protein n=1 Tax=Lophiotrema nucula TaxID=690887 RepID=A0A6A5ZDT6_9PLEO|nr:hypothetical protein BDV96DRAFT_658169 [Lophiotrema nucula]
MRPVQRPPIAIIDLSLILSVAHKDPIFTRVRLESAQKQLAKLAKGGGIFKIGDVFGEECKVRVQPSRKSTQNGAPVEYRLALLYRSYQNMADTCYERWGQYIGRWRCPIWVHSPAYDLKDCFARNCSTDGTHRELVSQWEASKLYHSSKKHLLGLSEQLIDEAFQLLREEAEFQYWSVGTVINDSNGGETTLVADRVGYDTAGIEVGSMWLQKVKVKTPEMGNKIVGMRKEGEVHVKERGLCGCN